MAYLTAKIEGAGLNSRDWLLSYKTSSTIIDGRPVDILQDFYVPALRLAVRYDRVAGYFRSSSLAAASQGFSAFVGRQGRMRLIVGADLEVNDVMAILDGDTQRLADRLNTELDQPESWPEQTQNGVKLLAWMVARGYLEVRVAFRVHQKTGRPLSFDAVDDGYVHEKWFVLFDEAGQRLYGAGTLNESKTALIINAENIDIHCDWWGETDRRRVNEAESSFENLWQGRVRHMPVLTLPEAVNKRLIKLAAGVKRPVEVDGSSHTPTDHSIEPPAAMERLRFAVLHDGPKMPGGRFVGMETAPVEPWPHQAVVARRLVETWPYSYLLCDEVGLGKTIEAGLAFRSLYLSGLVKRILIAAPASLTRQWHRQMASKMLLPFGRLHSTANISHDYILPFEEIRPASSIFEPDLIIMSTGLLARRERAAALKGVQPFDIALVDEAHALRRRNPTAGLGANPDYGHLYTCVQNYLRQQTRSLWLATATPMQIHPVEVCDLLTLTNRVGAFQFDPVLILQFYEILGKLVYKQDIGEQEWDFLSRAIRAIQMQDPMLWRYLNNSVIDGRLRVPVRQWLEYGRIPRGRDRELINRLIFSASPLSRVMMRHSRQLLEIYQNHGKLQQNLARRHILPIPRIVFQPLERQIYDQLQDYCDGLSQQIKAHGDSQSRQMMSFLLSFLRLRFASSLFAIRETLRRRLLKVEATLRHQLVLEAEELGVGVSSLYDTFFEGEDEDDLVAVESMLQNRTTADLEWERGHLKTMLGDLADLTGPASKMQVLLQTIDRRRSKETGRIQQIVIFTRFYDTLKDIVTRLRQADTHMLIGTYSGQGAEMVEPGTDQMIGLDREEVKERFLREEIDVLVCTDAAAEGLNLQTADLLINFDLGWNPMKIEQRIGRIDRIGQKHSDIYVLNLCYAGSAEEIVYNRLLTRLVSANMIVGTQQISLLPVEPEDFRQLAEGMLTPEGLEKIARERIEQQRKNTESMEINPKELYDIYMRMDSSDDTKPPVNLESIWETLSNSRYLSDLGCILSKDNKNPTLTLSGIEGVPNGTRLTTSRQLYEEGLADGGMPIHFASYGEPFFDTILECLSSFELPACVRRISVPVPGIEGVELVGYAATCQGEGGMNNVRLILSWSDLASLHLVETGAPTEAEIEPLREKLREAAINESAPYLAAARVERENIRAARAQEMLSLLVIRSLLEVRAQFAGEDALYGPVLREVESLYDDRERILVNDLPANLLRPISGDLLFECQVPNVGDKTHMLVSRILARSAIDAANRLVDSMKVRRGELRVDTVMARLQRAAVAKSRKGATN